jgi:hypothetical protein
VVAGTLAQLSAVFSRRFLFNALLPTLVFFSLSVSVVVANTGSLRSVGASWEALDIISKTVAVLSYLAAVWFLAAAVASQWRAIVRLFEGYPAMRLLRDHVPGIRWHQARRRLLWDGEQDGSVEADPDAAYSRYPLLEDASEDTDEAEVLPTTLGNILLAGERYAPTRYGMDTIYFWPRLYPLLPGPFQVAYEEFLIAHEFPLVVAFQAMVTAVIGGLTIVFTGGSPIFFVLWLGGGSAFAYAFYVLSFASAEELGEQQRTAFDLYRHLLLEQWATPDDVRDERVAFSRIEEFILWNGRPEWGRPQSLHKRRRRAE